MALFADAGIVQAFTDLIVLGVVVGKVAFGFKQGLFLAVLTGLGGLATLLFALGFGDLVESFLLSVDVPAQYAFPVSCGLLATGVALAVRVGIGAVPEGAVRFPPLIDKVGGALVGGLAGIIMAGTLLLVLSTMPIPELYRIDGSQARLDLGTRMLHTFARFIEPNVASRDIVLHGETASGEVGDGSFCSELFIDADGDGKFNAEAGERFLDHDGSRGFTDRAAFTDANGNKVRDIGLLERYRLGEWKKLRVMHHPTITSNDSQEIPSYVKDGAVVYQMTATDLDPGDTLTFSLEPPSEGVSLPDFVSIDPASGAVTVTDADTFMRQRKPAVVVVVATDSRGLTSKKTVTIRYRGPKPREE
ncbi:MAG: CvpA family protein [Planctomycetia bacterium]